MVTPVAFMPTNLWITQPGWGPQMQPTIQVMQCQYGCLVPSTAQGAHNAFHNG